jgi:hypothetical protein
MTHSVGLMGSMALELALVGLSGCPGGDDGGGETGAVMMSTGPAASSTGPVDITTSGIGSSEGSSGPASTSEAVDSSSSGAAVDSSSSGGGPVCEPPVVGEWNSCIAEDGDIDNTLCNWIGNPDGVGFLTCLSASELEGANVCIIRGCEDTCDCFEPPATGTAEVVCAAILADGEMGCGLDCSRGQTCPDGMECAGGLCFWPPA